MIKTIHVADRCDYVISNITNPVPPLSGPVQYTVSLDTDYPWMWTGFYLGSLYSDTPSGGGVVQVQPSDLTLQILDSNRNYLFSDYVPADTFEYLVTSSFVATGDNRNEIFIMNPEGPQPAGGSFIVYANNNNATGDVFFELVLTGYKVKDEQLKTQPPGRRSRDRNVLQLAGVR